jgi:hypothetical protein
MGSLEDRIRKLEEQFTDRARRSGPALINPRMAAMLDRIAAVKRGDPGISDEERAEVLAFERDLKAELKKRRAEGRI